MSSCESGTASADAVVSGASTSTRGRGRGRGRGRKRANANSVQQESSVQSDSEGKDKDNASSADTSRKKRRANAAVSVTVPASDEAAAASKDVSMDYQAEGQESSEDDAAAAPLPFVTWLSAPLLPCVSLTDGVSDVGSTLPESATSLLMSYLDTRTIVCHLLPVSRSTHGAVLNYAGKVDVARRVSAAPLFATASTNSTVSSASASSLQAGLSSILASPSSIESLLLPSSAALRAYDRVETLVSKTRPILRLLLASPARSIVSKLEISHDIKLNAEQLEEITEALPSLAHLRVTPATAKVEELKLPPLLRSLDVHVEVPRVRIQGYSQPDFDKCRTITSLIVKAIVQLKALETLEMSSGDGAVSPLAPLAQLPHLRIFIPRGYDFRSGAENMLFTFRALKELFGSFDLNEGPARLNALLSPGKLAPLHKIHLERVALSDAIVQLLRMHAATLQSIVPCWWDTAQTGFLSQFPQLRELTVYQTTSKPGLLSNVSDHKRIKVEELVPALLTLTLMESLELHVRDLNSEHLTSILGAMPHLRSLKVTSRVLNRLDAFVAHVHTASTLCHLTLNECCALPTVAMAKLLRLRALESLSIAGSFVEPLYFTQLEPFVTSVKRCRDAPLSYLRQFTPRSPNEPVPPAPIDPAAVTAAIQSFESRLQSSAVGAAELVNSAHLSAAFAFLTQRDFSIAARTCRRWRAAASLPCSWPTDVTARPLHISDPFLVLLLPMNPLWRHARSLIVSDNRSFTDTRLLSLDAVYDALAQMTRIERLGIPILYRSYIEIRTGSDGSSSSSTSFTYAASDSSIPTPSGKERYFASPAAQRLREILSVDPQLLPHLSQLTQIRCLEFTSHGSLDPYWLHLLKFHHLETLSLNHTQLNAASGEVLRQLSVDHALRHVSYQRIEGAHSNRAEEFVDALMGRLSVNFEQVVEASLAPTAAVTAAAKGPSSFAIAASPLKPAARLHTLHVHVSLPLPLTLLTLPALTALDYHLDPPNYFSSPTPVDLQQLSTLAASGSLCLLKSLRLKGLIVMSSMLHIAELRELRELNVYPMGRFRSEPWELDPGILSRWCSQLRQLESLTLTWIAPPVDEWAELRNCTQLTHLSISRVDQDVEVRHLSFIPSLPQLCELDLSDCPGLLIRKRGPVVPALTPAEGGRRVWADEEDENDEATTDHVRSSEAAAALSEPAANAMCMDNNVSQPEPKPVDAIPADLANGKTESAALASSTPVSVRASAAVQDLYSLVLACPLLTRFTLHLSDSMMQIEVNRTHQLTLQPKTRISKSNIVYAGQGLELVRLRCMFRQLIKEISQRRAGAAAASTSGSASASFSSCSSPRPFHAELRYNTRDMYSTGGRLQDLSNAEECEKDLAEMTREFQLESEARREKVAKYLEAKSKPKKKIPLWKRR